MAIEFNSRVVRVGHAGFKFADVFMYPCIYFAFRFAALWHRGADFCCSPEWRFGITIIMIGLLLTIMLWTMIPQAICAFQAKRAGDSSEATKGKTPYYMKRSRGYILAGLVLVPILEVVHQLSC